MRKLGIRDITEIAIFVALVAAGAFIKIPNPFFPLVPITLQAFFAIMSGLVLGHKKGSISMLIYMLLGLFGVPVFTSGGGVGYVFHHSFGYIIGFIFAAFFAGLIMEKSMLNFAKPFIASLSSLLVIYLIGNTYLYIIFKYVVCSDSTFIGVNIAMTSFMAKDLVLAFFAAIIAPRIRMAVKNI